MLPAAPVTTKTESDPRRRSRVGPGRVLLGERERDSLRAAPADLDHAGVGQRLEDEPLGDAVVRRADGSKSTTLTRISRVLALEGLDQA